MKSIKDLLEIDKHSYKCYIRAFTEFNNALFHIFAGPLFANVADYKYFDLIIWSVSPLMFLFLRDHLVAYFSDRNRSLKGTTFSTLMVCAFTISCSYFFLNFSPIFKWNSFSVTFNLDVGYFIFDFVIRTIEILIQLQPDPEFRQQNECQTYCKFQHASISLSYWLVFIMASTFEINDKNNQYKIFSWCSILSFISIIVIPFIFYQEQYRNLQYVEIMENEVQVSENFMSKKLDAEILSTPKIRNKIIGVFLITSSWLLNLNYLSLWMMEPLNTTGDSSALQFNITIQMVSGFFMLSSTGYYIASWLFSQFGEAGEKVARILLFVYGLFICGGYWFYHVNYISALILGFGFHMICVMEFSENVTEIFKIDLLKLSLYNQIIVYAIVPMLLMLLNIGQDDLSIFCLFSGVSLTIGTIFI